MGMNTTVIPSSAVVDDRTITTNVNGELEVKSPIYDHFDTSNTTVSSATTTNIAKTKTITGGTFKHWFVVQVTLFHKGNSSNSQNLYCNIQLDTVTKKSIPGSYLSNYGQSAGTNALTMFYKHTEGLDSDIVVDINSYVSATGSNTFYVTDFVIFGV